MKYEDLLEDNGKIGKYQLFIAALLVLSTIPNGALVNVVIFTNYTPNHRCKIPGLNNVTAPNSNLTYYDFGNKSADEILNMTIPWETKDGKLQRSQCKMIIPGLWQQNDELNYTSTNLIGCQYGWHYDIEEGRSSTITDWDLVCDKAWLKPMTTSMYNVGVTVASLCTGVFSDRFGRRRIFLLTTYLQFLITFLCCFSVNVTMYAIVYMLAGACSLTNFMAAVVLMYEVVGNERRYTAGIIQMMTYAIGYMLVPLSSYLIGSWRWLLASLGFQIVFFIPYYWFIPESLQWLILNRKYEEAKNLTQTIINWNKLPESANEIFNRAMSIKESGEKVKQLSYWHLMKYPYIRKTTTILCFAWLFSVFGYFGLAYNSANLSGNVYVTCLLSGFVEIPAGLLMMICQRFGRVKFILAFGATNIVIFVIMFFLVTGFPMTTTVLSMIGKFLMTGLFDVLYLYSPEVYPVLLRQQGLAITATFGRLGSIIAPYIVYAAEQNGGKIMYGLFAGTTILLVILSVMLPETHNTSLPSTVKEAIQLNRYSVFSRSKLFRRKNKNSVSDNKEKVDELMM